MGHRTVVISDLHAEISPKKVIDLERVADIVQIQKSYDLKVALQQKHLQLIRHNIIETPQAAAKTVKIIEKHTETIIERDKLEDERLVALIKAAVAESVPKQEVNVDEVVSRAVDAKVGNVNTILSDIRDKIANFRLGGGPEQQGIETSIDPARLAEMAGKSVDKIAGELESTIKQSRKIRITPTKSLDDLASELE